MSQIRNCPICDNPLTIIYEEIMDTYLMEREEACQIGCHLYREHYVTGSTKISIHTQEFSWFIYDNPEQIEATQRNINSLVIFLRNNLITIQDFKRGKMDAFPRTNIYLNTIWSELRWLRQMRKMTLREVAERTGLSISFISDIEHGRSNPSLASLQKLVVAYKAPIAIHINFLETKNELE